MFEKGQRITSPGKYDQFSNLDYVYFIQKTIKDEETYFNNAGHGKYSNVVGDYTLESLLTINEICRDIARNQKKANEKRAELELQKKNFSNEISKLVIMNAKSNPDDPELLKQTELVMHLQNEVIRDLEFDLDCAEDRLLKAVRRYESWSESKEAAMYFIYSTLRIDQHIKWKADQKAAQAKRESQRRQAEVETYYEPENSSSSTLLKSAAIFGAGAFVGSRIAKKKESVPVQRKESYSDRYERQKYEREKAEFIYGGGRYSSSIQREAAWNKSHENQERKFYG